MGCRVGRGLGCLVTLGRGEVLREYGVWDVEGFWVMRGDGGRWRVLLRD